MYVCLCYWVMLSVQYIDNTVPCQQKTKKCRVQKKNAFNLATQQNLFAQNSNNIVDLMKVMRTNSSPWSKSVLWLRLNLHTKIQGRGGIGVLWERKKKKTWDIDSRDGFLTKQNSFCYLYINREWIAAREHVVSCSSTYWNYNTYHIQHQATYFILIPY